MEEIATIALSNWHIQFLHHDSAYGEFDGNRRKRVLVKIIGD